MKKTLIAWRLVSPYEDKKTTEILLKEGFQIEKVFTGSCQEGLFPFNWKDIFFRKGNKVCRLAVEGDFPSGVTSAQPENIEFLSPYDFWAKGLIKSQNLTLENFLKADASSADFMSVEERKEKQLQEILKNAPEVVKVKICLLPRKSWVSESDFPEGVILVTPLYDNRMDRTMTVSIPCTMLPSPLEKWWYGSSWSPTKGTMENTYTLRESNFTEFVEYLRKAIEKVAGD